MADLTIFSGNANLELAKQISETLSVPLGKCRVDRFSDGEVAVEILENVRGKDVFILQPTCSPSNTNLMELMLMADAIRRSSGYRITAVMPYFGYGRQDRRSRSARVPISAKIVADMLESVDVDRVLTVDLHADQIQGFFSIPVDNVYGSEVLIKDLKNKEYHNHVMVSPDIGGVVRARIFAKTLNTSLAIIDKRRPEPNKAEVMNVIGKVRDKDCILVDDMVDTGGTLCAAASALLDKGAKSVAAYCTHPIFSGKAIENIKNSALSEVVVTNTVPLSENALKCKKIRQLSIAGMLSEAIKRVHKEESISCMFS